MHLSRRWRSAAATLAASCVLLGATAVAPAQAADGLPIVYGWGWNQYGQVGNGTTGGPAGSVDAPAPVAGLATDVVQVDDDGDTTVMVRSDGSVWTWGRTISTCWETAVASPPATSQARCQALQPSNR